MDRNPPLEIALAFNVGVTHLERVVRGIRDYAKRHTDWRFLISPETHYLAPAALKGWQGDGVIALANQPEDVSVLASLDCPVINLSGASENPGFPRVRPDYFAIGRMAAQHLIERGYRRFGYYGMAGVWYSSCYEHGFSAELALRGFECARLHVASTLSAASRWNTGQKELESWLSSLVPPFAVMAAHDPRAAMILRSCERVGLRVPEDVAVIGVNNDTVACESCQPTLTSIERNDPEIGREAARLLDALIQGEAAPSRDRIVPPGAIRERASTDSLGVEHPDLLSALRYAREHFREPIGVADLVRACPRSRRWLEEAFLEQLDCTPRSFLFRLRLKEAQRLLAQHPGLRRSEVARLSGYSGTRQLNAHLGDTARKPGL